MSTTVWAAAAVTALVAAYVQGLTVLGYAIVFTPVLVLLVRRPQEVVLASLLLGAVLSAGVPVDGRKAFRPRRGWPLLAGAAVGTPVGVLLLPHLPRTTLTVLIAVTALVLAAVWVVRVPKPARHETPVVAVAGLLGGFLNGTTSMGGPPPALTASMQRWPVTESRAALVTFNLASYVVAVAIAVAAGFADTGFLARSLWLLPPAVAGSCSAAGRCAGSRPARSAGCSSASSGWPDCWRSCPW
ncbi:MAG: sulfite exporter TauE/SafE family protein [Streptosporangiales bacterium]|nr:sulfite exporter TauE/SafE family protein [Streptosporangiales bacterium]MBO0890356.1 sulfite exporter TauE/SafE family protein [Acidothermales bacterium]